LTTDGDLTTDVAPSLWYGRVEDICERHAAGYLRCPFAKTGECSNSEADCSNFYGERLNFDGDASKPQGDAGKPERDRGKTRGDRGSARVN